MSASADEEIVREYIEEVKTYIPMLMEGMETLKDRPDKSEVLEEAHRLVHTIKGASSMVGMYGLSHIALQMEDALDEIMDGSLSFDEEAFRVMADTIARFRKYCQLYVAEGVDSRKMLKDTVLAYRRLRGLPEDEDQTALNKVVEAVPEIEGGNGSKDVEPETAVVDEDDIDLEMTDAPAPDFDASFADEFIPEIEPGFDEMEIEMDDFGEEEEEVEIDPELMESFREEASEHLEGLSNQLADLELKITGPKKMSAKEKESVREIRRFVHTIKGAAAVIGLENISAFAHKWEDMLDWVYERAGRIDPEMISLMLASSDLLTRIVENPRDPKSATVAEMDKKYRLYMDQGVQHAQEPDTDIQDEIKEDDEVSAEPLPEYESEAGEETQAPEETAEIDPELIQSFNEEAREHLDSLGRLLAQLESGITRREKMSKEVKEALREIRRAVHTVKGAAAVIGLTNISGFAHSLEDLLDWMYETADTIDPEMVSVMLESSDLLERLVDNPNVSRKSQVTELKENYREIMGEPGGKPAEKGEEVPAEEPVQRIETGRPAEPDEEDESEEEETETVFSRTLSGQTKTLRIDTERVDELVNLVGELIIALSGFDQRMDAFREAVNELELSRERLRDIAREMELGYEVKALEGKTGLPFSFGQKMLTVGGETKEFADFDSMELDRYSALNLIIRTLNESVIDVSAIHNQLTNLHSDMDGNLNRERVLLSELQDKMMRVRMTPMSILTNRMRRTVREVASKLGKKIRLIIEGSEIELDRLVWDKVTDPLMHLLRNAADHGIEPPALRQAMGKPPVATLKLAASREGNQVVIRIVDDGAGLNYEAIRNNIKKLGLSDKYDQLSENELAGFIFHPGFSTRGKITEVSGRGVGMDVVKQNIEELKGSVNIYSESGKGAQFTLRIPLTLAAVRALLFSVGGQVFAIALNEIREILRISPERIYSEPNLTVRLENDVLPLYYASQVLKTGVSEKGVTSENPIILVVESGGLKGALVIDNLVDQREIVIKSTGSHLRYVRGISGVTIMGDGSVIPILNVEELLKTETGAKETDLGRKELLAEKPLEVMVVDDSVSIRTVVSRLMEEQGWEVHTAKDGIDALEKLRETRPEVIILDIEMPRMNGYEFLSAMRTEPNYKKIPVIMLTSRTTAKHREKAMSLGAKGFIVKPYKDEEFIDLVLQVADRN